MTMLFNLCSKLKRMSLFRDKIKEISSESTADKIERSFDICKDKKRKIILSESRKGHEHCIDYCNTCPPETEKIADVHTHPTVLTNPSISDYIISIKNNEKLFCISGNDPYRNNKLTVKCYSIPEELFDETDSIKRHNKVVDLLNKKPDCVMIIQ